MRITASPQVDQVKPEEAPRFTAMFLEQVVQAFNSNLRFGENVSVSIVTANFTQANTNTQVSHGLGRAPQGYIQVGSNAATMIYDGTSANSDSVLNLRSSAIAVVQVMVF